MEEPGFFGGLAYGDVALVQDNGPDIKIRQQVADGVFGPEEAGLTSLIDDLGSALPMDGSGGASQDIEKRGERLSAIVRVHEFRELPAQELIRPVAEEFGMSRAGVGDDALLVDERDCIRAVFAQGLKALK
jgi:hypothetical protein